MYTILNKSFTSKHNQSCRHTGTAPILLRILTRNAAQSTSSCTIVIVKRIRSKLVCLNMCIFMRVYLREVVIHHAAPARSSPQTNGRTNALFLRASRTKNVWKYSRAPKARARKILDFGWRLARKPTQKRPQIDKNASPPRHGLRGWAHPLCCISGGEATPRGCFKGVSPPPRADSRGWAHPLGLIQGGERFTPYRGSKGVNLSPPNTFVRGWSPPPSTPPGGGC